MLVALLLFLLYFIRFFEIADEYLCKAMPSDSLKIMNGNSYESIGIQTRVLPPKNFQTFDSPVRRARCLTSPITETSSLMNLEATSASSALKTPKSTSPETSFRAQSTLGGKLYFFNENNNFFTLHYNYNYSEE